MIDLFLARAARILPEGAPAGFLLPAYSFQTFGRVIRWNSVWSIDVTMIPRGLFGRLRLPLSFALFRKDKERRLVGLALYHETVQIANLAHKTRESLARPSRRGAWFEAVHSALTYLGGRGTLPEIYQVVEPRRPYPNAWWREKVRQTLQMHFTSQERGVWEMRGPVSEDLTYEEQYLSKPKVNPVTGWAHYPSGTSPVFDTDEADTQEEDYVDVCDDN